MKLKTKLGLVVVLCLSQFFIECSNPDLTEITIPEPVEEEIDEEIYEEIIKLKKFISESRGIDIKEIIYSSGIKGFVIFGDVVLLLEDVREQFDKMNSNNTVETRQTYSRIDRITAPYTPTM